MIDNSDRFKVKCDYCKKEFYTKYTIQKFCGEDCRFAKIKTERSINKKPLNKQNINNFDIELKRWMVDNPITKLPDGSTTIYGSPTNPNIKIRLYKERLYKNWQRAR